MLIVNGVRVVSPKTIRWDMEDIYADGSGRNAKGDYIGDIIATKRKGFFAWGHMNQNEMTTLLRAFGPAVINLDFFDAEEGRRIVKSFYKSARSAPLYRYNKEKNMYLWEGLSMNLIER